MENQSETSFNIDVILKELSNTLSTVSDIQTQIFRQILIQSKGKKIVGVGAGRVGYALKSFCMRLGHMGFNCWFIGDTTVPSIGKDDILIVASGSGETKTIVELVKIASKNECTILCVTGNRNSTIGLLANHVIDLKAPSYTKNIDNVLSSQPMTTLNEQCLSILFDALSLDLMSELNETHETMWARHSNLE